MYLHAHVEVGHIRMQSEYFQDIGEFIFKISSSHRIIIIYCGPIHLIHVDVMKTMFVKCMRLPFHNQDEPILLFKCIEYDCGRFA